MFIIIECDLPVEDAEEACMELSEMLDSNVFVGDVRGWKIPTAEDWG